MANPFAPVLYDRLLAPVERAGLAARRAALLAGARGAVLEVGAGTGLNLPHYPAAVTRLVLSDPDERMRARLRRRVQTLGRDAEVVDAEATALPFLENSFDEVVDAEATALPFLENSFDEVVVTLVLCHVDRRVTALHEVRRVLRPGGTLRFIEHVAGGAHGPSPLQRAVQPVHRLVARGCRLDHRMTASLREAAFEVDWITDWELPRAPRWVRPAVVGVARAPA